MSTQATHAVNDSGPAAVLYMSLELSSKTWKLMFTNGARQRIVDIPARDVSGVLMAAGKAKDHFGLAAGCRVVSCYEAGRDGFWLHRALLAEAIANLVIDSSAIEVSRRAKSAKTDGIDVVKLNGLLRRYDSGDTTAFRVVRVPSEAAEDDRRMMRELERLKKECGQHRSRIKSLLALHGIVLPRLKARSMAADIAGLRIWGGKPVPPRIAAEIVRESERLALVLDQMVAVLKIRRARERAGRMALQEERAAVAACAAVPAASAVTAMSSAGRPPGDPAARVVTRLMQLKALGPESSWTLGQEFFAWRSFANRREIAAAAGLSPTPYASGGSHREQGLDKSGNRRVRVMLVELSWMWLRHQPGSALTLWYKARFAGGGARARKVGIVALARKLLIALWRYVTAGVVPEGAILKA